MNRRGFTLIEMLVVIVIIGILAGLIYPSMLRVRRKGWAIQCAANLKQLNTAAANHGAEHTRWPIGVTWENEFKDIITGWISWITDEQREYYFESPEGLVNIRRGQLWEHMNNQIKVYVCPVHLRENSDAVRSYSIASEAVGAETYGVNYLGFQNASRRPLFAEIQEARLDHRDEGSYFSNTNQYINHNRHGDGRLNVIFCDGHLEKVRVQP